MKVSKKFLANLRHDYMFTPLHEKAVGKNPIRQFEKWFAEALNAKVLESNAMVLATASKHGKPSSRIVLLKGFDNHGFVFFTNYRSRKGKELLENPFASLTFFWRELSRQVHIEGRVKKIAAKQSDEYFQSRPRGSQVGALASAQSEVVESREILEKRMEELTRRYANQQIPTPKHWGGYILVPDKIEFWQGRANRLHDRLLYKRQKNSQWKIQRLSP